MRLDEHATRGCGEALLSWLAHDARRWSVLEFGLFPPESELTQRLSGLVDGSGWHRAEISRDVASLPLPGTYEDWYSSRSKHLRRKIRRTQAKATQHKGSAIGDIGNGSVGISINLLRHITGLLFEWFGPPLFFAKQWNPEFLSNHPDARCSIDNWNNIDRG